MPVNFVDIKQRLESYGREVKAAHDEQLTLESELWQQYQQSSDQVEAIRTKVLQAAGKAKNLWCACPTAEPLLTHLPCPPLPGHYTILAADGSQIAPSRHKAMPYCVVNVGLIIAHMGSGEAPTCETHSMLKNYAEIFNENGLANDDLVSLWRDHSERMALVAATLNIPGPIIALTDGLLGLYQVSRPDIQLEPWAEQIQAAFKTLENRGVIAAGYIDKPGSDLIGRMFSLLQLPETEQAGFNAKDRHFQGISDATLLSRVLQNPGERSAIFKVISTQDRRSENDLEVHFFYLNISNSQTPCLVRVEIPGWIVPFEDRINFLHAALVSEARVLDLHPYPYILHRAHELAVIHFSEHEEVERLLMEAYQAEGIPLGAPSNKQANKDLNGRQNIND